MTDEIPFWKRKTLDEMTMEEWESLCDGCARCCLVKLEDEDTRELAYTRVACELLDIGACRCSDYANRQVKIPGCVKLTPKRIADIEWMPDSCAYKLVANKQDLEWWHPLVSGSFETVHEAGMSVRDFAIGEKVVKDGDYERYVINSI